jgi:DNA-binding phage protein
MVNDLSKAAEVWEVDLAEDLRDPELAALYTIEYTKANAIADLFEILEEARERQSLTKAGVAGRIRRHASALSRLLSGRNANPTLETLVSLSYALGIELEVHVKGAPRANSPMPYRPMTVINDLGAHPRFAAP